MTEIQRLLEGFSLVSTYPILWGNLDSFGHVNNLVFLRWAEAARVEYLMKVDQFPELPPEGVGPILASQKCDYRRQLNFPGTVLVGTRISRLGRSSMRMEHVIVSQEMCAVVAEVDSTLVLLDYSTGKAEPIPQEVREVIAGLEGKPLEDLCPA
jgi:acyl-CoA thioester hydrolase